MLNNSVVASDSEAGVSQKGKFKTPTLRNIAITAPYMHNGVFQTLEAVLSFYQHAKIRAKKIDDNTLINDVVNPDTGMAFGDPEVNENISHDLLAGSDSDLDDDEIEQLECFFMSLTDQRYESLLDQDKVTACGL